jgi:uncharacterized tellurite resistance protein B-like protein
LVPSTTRDQVRECLNLVEAAERNGCPDTACALRAIPPETYANLAAVLASVALTDDELSESEMELAHRTHTKPGLA